MADCQTESFFDDLDDDEEVFSMDKERERDFGQCPLNAWEKLRDSGQHCDVTLLIGENAKIHVHRSIMAACSPYFHALFTNNLDQDCQKKTNVHIPGIEYDMMWYIIHHAYTGKTLVDSENVASLLPAADQFNMLRMIQDCTNFLLSKMTPTNCIGILMFARQFFCQELVEQSHKFLMCRFPDVAETSEELLDLPIEEVIDIFSSIYLNVSDERTVWEVIVKWIDRDPEHRRIYIADLMKCVRLGLLDANYFMEQVKNHRFVANNEQCKTVIIETMRFLYDLQDITNRQGEVPTPLIARPRIPNEIMFAVGGWSGGSPTNSIETYDTRADRWIQVEEIDTAGPRAYHKCAAVGHNIYVIGGFNGNFYFSSCRCFNAITKTWKEIAPMTTRRCYVSTAVVGNTLYAMGGYDGHHRQNTAEKYDIENNQWTNVATMNAQRSDACATELTGEIYITGGFNGTECLNSCERYNPELNVWHEISSMKTKRSGVSCISHAGRIFALGGFNGISRLQSGEKYDPEADQWTSIPDMFNPRSNFAIEVMDKMIFVVGGFNGVSTIDHVECFDDKNNEWLEATDMNTIRSALAACVIKGLPNVSDYIHKNRENLMEEKRQKLLQMQTTPRNHANPLALPPTQDRLDPFPGLHRALPDIIEVDDEIEDEVEIEDEEF